MRNKEIKKNQIMNRLTISMSFAIFCVIVLWGITVTSQNQEKQNNKTTVERNVDNSKDSNKEIHTLIETLKDKNKSPKVIFAAIQTLGKMKSTEAIPELIEYLDYEKLYSLKQPDYAGNVKIDGIEIGQTIPISGRYPATGALFQIGEPALPALVKVIENEKPSSVKSQNSLYAIQQIFVEDQLKAVLYLEKAVTESKSANGVKRLQLAAQITKEKWENIQNKLSN